MVEHTLENLEDIEHWFKTQVASVANLPLNAVDYDTPIADYGLDSSAMLEMACNLEDLLNIEMEHTELYDFETINALASHIFQLKQAQLVS